MKLPVRDTQETQLSIRITAPEYKIDPATKKKVPLLCWADDSSNHHRSGCTRELFLYAAGNNEVGEKPEGLDRLSSHHFYIHFDGPVDDPTSKAIGMDEIPSRQFGSRIVPQSQVGVTTLKLRYETDGSGVVRILERPVNTKPEVIRRLIVALDALGGKSLKIGMTPVPGNAARIVSLNDGVVEVRLSARASRESVHSNLLDAE